MPFDRKLPFTVFGLSPFAIVLCYVSFQSCAAVFMEGIWNVAISHKIFRVLDYLCMDTCTVQYYAYGYNSNLKYIFC